MSEPVRDHFEQLLSELRPKLHRYCARMTGSAVDGEDVLQDAIVKVLSALPQVGSIDNPEGWLFRVAHNTALDFLRRRARAPVVQNEEVLAMLPAPDVPDDGQEAARASLRTFLRLPALQRSAVILKDVLGHSVEEIASITGASEAAAKSALQRGRARLRELGSEPEQTPPPNLPDDVRVKLIRYVEGFTNRDFDAIRAMLADDVRLDLVARLRRQGKTEVREYFDRYAACDEWAFAAAGIVDGRAAMLVYDRQVSLETPAYFVALEFDGDRVTSIYDFLFARYAMEGVEWSVLDRTAGPR